MCAILGFFNLANNKIPILRGLAIMNQRGQDGCGACGYDWVTYASNVLKLEVKDDIGIIGQNLHSLVNNIKQPIVGKGKLVSNCEFYNWKTISLKYNINAKNDSDLLLKLIDYKINANNETPIEPYKAYCLIESILSELRGVYSFAYWIEDLVFVFRDIIGVRPLWYSLDSGFGFASEKKVLKNNFFPTINELDPRIAICYNINKNIIQSFKRPFISTSQQSCKSYRELELEFKNTLENAVSIRLPSEPFGILYSGGLDSTVLAVMAINAGKVPGKDFFCYTTGLFLNDKAPKDVEFALKAIKDLGLKLRLIDVKLQELEEMLIDTVYLIEDTHIPKIGVGVTIYSSCMKAKEDNIRVIFAGTGADELLAGYDRYKSLYGDDIQDLCYKDVLNIYQENCYRDDVVTMNNGIELRLPYLDTEFVKLCLSLPHEYKLYKGTNKLILRNIGKQLGIPEEFVMRKKKAAQYGSKFDKGIEKLAKARKAKNKTDYIKSIKKNSHYRLGALFSSGKDSNYALYIMLKEKYHVNCLITIKSKNPHSYMFHTPNIDLAQLQAESIDIPLLEKITDGRKEHELDDLKEAIEDAIRIYGINGIVVGAIWSTYQKNRIEKICNDLGLRMFSPLWHMNQETEMRSLLEEGFSFIFSSIAADGLDSSWLGKPISHLDIDKLVKLNEKNGVNIAGEGGEFESFVINGPIYKKKIQIDEYEVIELDENTAKLQIINAKLVDD
ncbi:asparagine synthase (glutamine-hydrolyzing) [Methanosalsum natronophilum]|nr:asparagine synthase (glutamine-hydrolyzing) [Methanosalsum natronophilum]